MSQMPAAIDPRLALLPPRILEEMLAAKAEIDNWYMSGGIPSAAPVNALIKWARELLTAGHQSLKNLANPVTRQAMSLEKKQGYLDEFREILEVRAGDWLDVADLTAEAERVKSGAQQDWAEGRQKVAKWAELATMLQEENDMVRRIAEQVVELEAEEGLR